MAKKATTKKATTKKATAPKKADRSWTAPNTPDETPADAPDITTAVDAFARAVNRVSKRTKIAKTTPNAPDETAAAEPTPAPQTQTANDADLVTFALRLPKDEAREFHANAGPRRGSQIARALMLAYINADLDGFRNLLDSRAN